MEEQAAYRGANTQSSISDTNLIKLAMIDWINLHTEEERNKPYLVSSSGAFSLNQLLVEITEETPVAIDIAKKLVYLTIDLLVRGKEKFK